VTRVAVAEAWSQDYAERVDERTLEMARLAIEGGLPYSEIGQRFGVSRQRVQQLLKPLDLMPGNERRHARYLAELARARQRIEEGSTLDIESERLGITKDWLRKAFIKQGFSPVRIEPPPPPAHGSFARYSSKHFKCRCPECRAANRARYYERKAKGPSMHGTISAYKNYGCRCPECDQAARLERRRIRADKRKGEE
jgi:hypothetical protein